MQRPLHEESGGEQAQRPPTQACVAGQALPHAPQSSGDELRFTQKPLQSTVEPGQRHWPALQGVPAGQVVPQLPQLRGSVEVSTQSRPHWVRGAMHTGFMRQRPWVQVAPEGQVLPHIPQLAGSL